MRNAGRARGAQDPSRGRIPQGRPSVPPTWHGARIHNPSDTPAGSPRAGTAHPSGRTGEQMANGDRRLSGGTGGINFLLMLLVVAAFGAMVWLVMHRGSDPADIELNVPAAATSDAGARIDESGDSGR